MGPALNQEVVLVGQLAHQNHLRQHSRGNAVAWHVYDITFDGYEPLTGKDHDLATFTVTKDDGVKSWQVRVKARPSLRQALGGRVQQLDDRDLAAGLGAQAIIVMLENGLEVTEQDIVLDASHYPGRAGEPAIVTDYRHLTVRVETTPEGEVVPPLGAQSPSMAGHPRRP